MAEDHPYLEPDNVLSAGESSLLAEVSPLVSLFTSVTPGDHCLADETMVSADEVSAPLQDVDERSDQISSEGSQNRETREYAASDTSPAPQ